MREKWSKMMSKLPYNAGPGVDHRALLPAGQPARHAEHHPGDLAHEGLEPHHPRQVDPVEETLRRK